MPSAVANNINIANLRIADPLSSDRVSVLHPLGQSRTSHT